MSGLCITTTRLRKSSLFQPFHRRSNNAGAAPPSKCPNTLLCPTSSNSARSPGSRAKPRKRCWTGRSQTKHRLKHWLMKEHTRPRSLRRNTRSICCTRRRTILWQITGKMKLAIRQQIKTFLGVCHFRESRTRHGGSMLCPGRLWIPAIVFLRLIGRTRWDRKWSGRTWRVSWTWHQSRWCLSTQIRNPKTWSRSSNVFTSSTLTIGFWTT